MIVNQEGTEARAGTIHHGKAGSTGKDHSHSFHILSATWAGLERVRKVVRFSRNLVTPELHDAHGVGGLAVIGQDEFGDPKITAANDSPDSKALPVRLDRAGDQYVAATAYALA